MYGKRVGAQNESKRRLIMDLEIDNRNNPILINSNDESFESLKQNQNQIQQYQTTNNDKILGYPRKLPGID